MKLDDLMISSNEEPELSLPRKFRAAAKAAGMSDGEIEDMCRWLVMAPIEEVRDLSDAIQAELARRRKIH